MFVNLITKKAVCLLFEVIIYYLYSISGTNGAISLVGTIASVLGGLLVGSTYYLTLLLLANENYLISSPPQWPLIVIGGILGLTGSVIDSILGATVQYSGVWNNIYMKREYNMSVPYILKIINELH